MTLPTIADRVDALRDSKTRETLIPEAKAEGGFGHVARILHPLGMDECPNFDLDDRASLEQLAEETKDDPVEIYVSRLLQSEGRELLNWWAFGNALQNQWKYMKVPHVIPMLGDAGAHVGLFTDADSPTFLLSQLTRRRGIHTLPEAIHRITAQSARILGLVERWKKKKTWLSISWWMHLNRWIGEKVRLINFILRCTWQPPWEQ